MAANQPGPPPPGHSIAEFGNKTVRAAPILSNGVRQRVSPDNPARKTAGKSAGICDIVGRGGKPPHYLERRLLQRGGVGKSWLLSVSRLVFYHPISIGSKFVTDS